MMPLGAPPLSGLNLVQLFVILNWNGTEEERPQGHRWHHQGGQTNRGTGTIHGGRSKQTSVNTLGLRLAK